MSHDIYRTADPVADAERYANRAIPIIGVCEQCGHEIYGWQDYYDVDGTLIHDDCGLDWLRQFRKSPD